MASSMLIDIIIAVVLLLYWNTAQTKAQGIPCEYTS